MVVAAAQSLFDGLAYPQNGRGVWKVALVVSEAVKRAGMMIGKPSTEAGNALFQVITRWEKDGLQSGWARLLRSGILAAESAAFEYGKAAGHRQADELGHVSDGRVFHEAICTRCGLELAYNVRDQVECVRSYPETVKGPWR